MKLYCLEDLGLLPSLGKEINLKSKKLNLYKKNANDLLLTVIQNNIFDSIEKEYIIFDFEKSFKDEPSKILVSLIEELLNSNANVYFVSEIKEPHKNWVKYFENKIIIKKKLNRLTIKKHINDFLMENGIKMGVDALNYLYNNLPTDAFSIENELNKISTYENITLTELKNIIPPNLSRNIHELIIYFFNGISEKVIELFEMFDTQKIEYYEVFGIIVSQIFNLKLYTMHYLQYKSINKILKDFSIQQFQIQNLIPIITKVKLTWIDKLLKNLLELDIDFKNGKKDIKITLKTIMISGGQYE